MAKLDLNGVSVEEINRNSNSVYAANIVSGEIFKVVCRHSKKGNVVLSIEGKALNCKDFNGDTFVVDGCILYNPPLIKAIVALCDDTDTPVFIIKGEVSKTAPATANSSDTVKSKEELRKEKEEIQKNYFSLAEADQKAAKSRIDAIETLLKTA